MESNRPSFRGPARKAGTRHAGPGGSTCVYVPQITLPPLSPVFLTFIRHSFLLALPFVFRHPGEADVAKVRLVASGACAWRGAGAFKMRYVSDADLREAGRRPCVLFVKPGDRAQGKDGLTDTFLRARSRKAVAALSVP